MRGQLFGRTCDLLVGGTSARLFAVVFAPRNARQPTDRRGHRQRFGVGVGDRRQPRIRVPEMGLRESLANALAGEEGRQRDADRVHVEVPLAVVSLDAGGLQVGEESRAARHRGEDRIARLGLPTRVLHSREAFGELWVQREHIVPLRLGRVPPQTEDRRIGVEQQIRPAERFRLGLPEPCPEEGEVERRPLEPGGTQLCRSPFGDLGSEFTLAGTAVEPLGREKGTRLGGLDQPRDLFGCRRTPHVGPVGLHA
jgi:hypothetical protein